MRGEINKYIAQNNALKRAKWKKHFRKYYMVYAILVPMICYFLVFNLFPVIYSFILSFTDFKLTRATTSFVGFENWGKVFTDYRIWRSVWVSARYTFMTVVGSILLGLVLAYLVNTERRGIRIFRVIYFLPSLTSAVVMAAIWRFIFSGSEYGIINNILSWFGIPTVRFYGDPKVVLITLALLAIFITGTAMMVYFIGGLKGIPSSVYESAKIDGANSFQAFTRVTLPLLKPTILYTSVICTIGSFQMFDIAHVLTLGGPNYASTTIMYAVYQYGFREYRIGYASTVAVFMALVIGILSLIQFKFLGGETSYE